ncbi:hypothetical protein [Paraburkholderia sp.]|jgi:hypothetical protein|uniref:hypothetical protein n=1 Tax=Paraburkholderia sp. TaxID=1926495 RepID=UPI002F42287B
MAAQVVTATLIRVILATVFVIEDTRNGRPLVATLAVDLLRNGMTTIPMLLARQRRDSIARSSASEVGRKRARRRG